MTEIIDAIEPSAVVTATQRSKLILFIQHFVIHAVVITYLILATLKFIDYSSK